VVEGSNPSGLTKEVQTHQVFGLLILGWSLAIAQATTSNKKIQKSASFWTSCLGKNQCVMDHGNNPSGLTKEVQTHQVFGFFILGWN
jgi:hypothetical protein